MSYIKKKSAKQESRTAKEFGGRTQLASGALWTSKGDVRTGTERTSSFNDSDYLIENKYTDKDSYKLERKIWEKIANEALRDNMRIPLMQVDIQDLQLVIMSFNDYKAMFDGYKTESYEFLTKHGSINLNKAELNSMIEPSQSDGFMPIFNIDFLGKVGTCLEIKLTMMLKTDYLDNIESL